MSCFGLGLHDPCEKKSINVNKTFKPYVAFVIQINYNYCTGQRFLPDLEFFAGLRKDTRLGH